MTPEFSPVSAAMVARSHAVGEPRISIDGSRIGWIDAFDGRCDLVIAPSAFDAPPAVVSADVAISGLAAYGGGSWCFGPGDTVLVSAADGALVQLRADGGGVVRRVPVAGRAFAPALGPDGSTVAACVEDDDSCAIATFDLAVPRPRALIVSDGADYSWDPAWSNTGALAWHEWDLTEMSWDGSRIALRSSEGEVRVVAGGDDIGVGQPRFSPDGRRLAWISDESGWWNIVVANADGTRARALRDEENDHAEPAWGPGQRSFAWSPDSRSIAFCRNEHGHGRLAVASLRGRSTRDVAKAWHRGIDWGSVGIVAARSGACTPQQIALTAPDGARRVLARGPVGGFEACGLVEPRPISWSSRRSTVHGLLYVPVFSATGVGFKPPLYVHVHGGPTDQSVVEWNARIAFWVSRGWAVLAPNYRGSTGYGRDYWKALEHQWGVRDVDDTVAGIRHVAREGWCDPRRVVVAGGSAGGYTALLIAAKYPMLARAIVSLYGVADLEQLARTTHRFESRYLDRLVGDPVRHSDRYADRSPVHLADRIRTPLLVLQGSDDPVVPLDQARAIVRAVRASGTPVESRVYRGEGHGFRRLEHRIDELQRTERFLTKWVLSR
jgi:dipeptidyl aminopeptidase/acylaminoacyl peptidase